MKIGYLFEAGVFGSYKKQRSKEDAIKTVAKDLAHVAKSALQAALLDKLYIKIEPLISEYLNKNYELYLSENNSGLVLVGKNGNRKEVYSGWYEIRDAKPVFRLAIENNTIVVILACRPSETKIIIQAYMNGLGWIKDLKKFLNSNIERITETGESFDFDGFDVKIEIDQDILDKDGRVKVDYVGIVRIHSIDGIQNFVDIFYNQDIRIKTNTLVFYCSMTSNKMYQEYIKCFPNLIRVASSISFDMSAMKEFDLENLSIISVLTYPHSDVEIMYTLNLDSKVSTTSLQGIEKFIHNEYNMTLEKFKEIAYQNKEPYDWYLRCPEDVKRIYVSYKCNNPKALEIKGMSR